MKNSLLHKVRQLRRKLLHSPPAQRMLGQEPAWARFIGRRLRTGAFVGLPLTLVAAALGLNLLLLSELTESIIESEWVVVLDMRFTAMLYQMRSEWLSQVLYACTRLANRETVFAVGGVLTAILLYRKRAVALVAFWLVLAGVGLSVEYGKTFIRRDRPAKVAYYPVENFSFPSGHATTVVGLYGMVAYFLYRHLGRRRGRRIVLWVATILMLLVGFSRIYLGVHYLSDVVAGFMLGALWLLVGISGMEVFMYRKKKRLYNRA